MRYFSVFLLFFINFSVFSQKIYVTDDISEADYVCYVTDNEYIADWRINVVDWERITIGRPGLWYYVDDKSDARYKIYFTDKKYLGCEKNRVIFFVDDKFDVFFEEPSKRKIKNKIKNCF